MIRLDGPEDAPAVLAQAARWPVTGALVEMYWHMQMENPRLPHRFYLLDTGAVLRLGGSRATLCGPAGDPGELAAFLRHERISQMTALDTLPPGWRVVEDDTLLLRPAGPAPLPPPPPGFEDCPSLEEVMAVLESQDGRMSPPAARDFFYADAAARRNHGGTVVYGIRREEGLAATAGLWALTLREGYVACVETRREYQGKGLASALLSQLVGRYGDRPLSLLCQPALCSFYARWGFVPWPGARGIISLDPTLCKEEAL